MVSLLVVTLIAAVAMAGALRTVRLRRKDDLRPGMRRRQSRALRRDRRRRYFQTEETKEGKDRDNPAEPGNAYTETRSH